MKAILISISIFVVMMAIPAPARADPGHLSPSDVDLLVRVRLAGLWEAPAGRQAQERASSSIVKEVGAHLASDHDALDVRVREVAALLNVPLPDRPNAEQQGWLDELSGLYGESYDRVFVDRLRAAHGKVFGMVAAVRAGTRNDLIREFAQHAVTVVMKHMTLLESTGLVTYGATSPIRRGDDGYPLMAWLMVFTTVSALVLTGLRIRRPY